jgi:uncharacterized membrane protein
VISLPEEEVAPSPQPEASSSGGGGGDDKVMAAISYIWVVSIIMLLTKKDSDFIQFHAKQGLVIFIISTVVWLVSIPFMFVLIFVNWIVYLVLFIAAVVGFIKAYNGERYRIPVVADIADKINL